MGVNVSDAERRWQKHVRTMRVLHSLLSDVSDYLDYTRTNSSRYLQRRIKKALKSLDEMQNKTTTAT